MFLYTVTSAAYRDCFFIKKHQVRKNSAAGEKQAYVQEAYKEQTMKDIEEVIQVFTSVQNYDQMQKLFEELFTMKEKYDIALRWRLMKDLYRGVPQREIAHELGISLCKITRGSKILKNEQSECRRLLEELDHENSRFENSRLENSELETSKK